MSKVACCQCGDDVESAEDRTVPENWNLDVDEIGFIEPEPGTCGEAHHGGDGQRPAQCRRAQSDTEAVENMGCVSSLPLVPMRFGKAQRHGCRQQGRADTDPEWQIGVDLVEEAAAEGAHALTDKDPGDGAALDAGVLTLAAEPRQTLVEKGRIRTGFEGQPRGEEHLRQGDRREARAQDVGGETDGDAQ